jgi:hypothetical protein
LPERLIGTARVAGTGKGDTAKSGTAKGGTGKGGTGKGGTGNASAFREDDVPGDTPVVTSAT